MHVCFHGGAVCDGGGRLAKSFNVISDFTKILIRRRDGDHARARRRRQMRRCKDAAPAAAAAAAVASAKIAPAQLQEEEGDGGGGGKEEEFCDKCCSALSGAGDAEEAAVTATEGEREWVAEPEPGVLLTLAPRADGVSNRLRRIRFREEVFDAWAAQCWWADNHDRIAELYCLVQPDDEEEEEIASAEAAMLPATPCQSEAEEEEDDGAAGAESSSRSPSTSTFSGGPSSGSGGGSTGTLGSPILGLVTNTGAAAAGAEHDAVRDQQPTAAPWTEWVEEYEAGVFITVGAYPGHRLQLRCVELSREMFGEVKARVWWEENKSRLHHLYSF